MAAATTLLCLHCSGGTKDANGAFTLCVLCALDEQEAA